VKLGRRTYLAYWGVVALFALVLGWWMIFFSRQGTVLVDRLEAGGARLNEAQTLIVRDVAERSTTMLMYEGGFLVLLLLAGVLLVLRSMRQEVLLHRQQRDFLSAVTHELRSPIASALLHVESLGLGRVPEQKRARYFEHLQQDLERLSELVDRLLATARASAGTVELARDRLDLGGVVEEQVERWSQAAREELELGLETPRGVTVEADAGAIETILHNLLANALKYGGHPTRVLVRVAREGSSAVLSVRDWGPGVGDDAGRLFDPFVRGAGPIVESRPGVGLGLYLVAELTRTLGGRVQACSPEDGGFEVRVTLPLAAGVDG
jgi:signal transduction histidine kinase